MSMWSDVPDRTDLETRRAARRERQERAQRSRVRRLSVTVTVLALIATAGVITLVRPAADVAPTADVAPAAALPTPAPTAADIEVEDQLRQALATGKGGAPAVSDEPPATALQASDVLAPNSASEADAPTPPQTRQSARKASAAADTSTDAAALPAASLPVISEGDYGTVIEVAQRALEVEPTGYFGPKTKAAVAEYQQELGLPTTGQIATFTWSALGAATVESALAVSDTPDGFVDGEPAEIQETPAPRTANRSARAGDVPVLEETDSGESVAVVQRSLGVKPATGYFGPLTAKAVRQFQSDNGIPTTGVIATYTWGALGREIAGRAAQAHATYGTVFGPGVSTGNSGGNSGNSGGGNSGGGNSGGGNSGGGNSGGSTSQGRDGLFCPVRDFYYGDGLGAPRPGGRTHAGLDLMGSRGEPIYAIDSGTVTRSGYQSNGSLILDITGSRGMYFYGHFDKILVGYGASIKAGQLIGYMGDTGSPGAVHLHLEVRPNGWSGGFNDPVPLIRSLCG